jgi:hypothetical protein
VVLWFEFAPDDGVGAVEPGVVETGLVAIALPFFRLVLSKPARSGARRGLPEARLPRNC